MNRLTSPAKAAALIISVLILGGVAHLAHSEQKPGDCGFYQQQWASGAASMR
jgi:hypothetical protein